MTGVVTVAQLTGFDEIIDVRTPTEFREDHIPGAVNLPVLYDEERARVGTLYKQVSPFEARKVGAALISRNIAHHIEHHLMDRPRDWRPLVYCWRGGKRSGALSHILSEIGWKVSRLEGGYKAYRRRVIEELATLPARFHFHIVCGPTGSGKSRLLAALARRGAQVLDLEALAAHRGSVLGSLPDAPQPSQKWFESQVWHALGHFDPARPVFVEGESKKIGNLRVPEALIQRMWTTGLCIRLHVDAQQRVALLKEEYRHFLEQPATLLSRLDALTALHGAERIQLWRDLATAGRWDELVRDLLEKHYDPSYTRSMARHYPQLESGPLLELRDTSQAAYDLLANELMPDLAEKLHAK
ncbi:tRNA 2-selenouridine(34) synthase MnmH [Thiobacter aerophilum]|uniref:tRNA 2-selenouridine(34) synthase MnmH n=1 Tax=Thiobacter aerophilum TaxID=3121275 RepID=A0ABV0EDT3_9BURK